MEHTNRQGMSEKKGSDIDVILPEVSLEVCGAEPRLAVIQLLRSVLLAISQFGFLRTDY